MKYGVLETVENRGCYKLHGQFSHKPSRFMFVASVSTNYELRLQASRHTPLPKTSTNALYVACGSVRS
jgi:hypothetical protein